MEWEENIVLNRIRFIQENAMVIWALVFIYKKNTVDSQITGVYGLSFMADKCSFWLSEI